ncbi:MAG: hypothetical protein IPN34_11415 [Planctomycetes bacterium]|nr:hypothetical protein [Planctomycetota bacterium]
MFLRAVDLRATRLATAAIDHELLSWRCTATFAPPQLVCSDVAASAS